MILSSPLGKERAEARELVVIKEDSLCCRGAGMKTAERVFSKTSALIHQVQTLPRVLKYFS